MLTSSGLNSDITSVDMFFQHFLAKLMVFEEENVGDAVGHLTLLVSASMSKIEEFPEKFGSITRMRPISNRLRELYVYKHEIGSTDGLQWLQHQQTRRTSPRCWHSQCLPQ